ncbi:MAG: branched-chain amino acid aminotransferase [Lachnospiraceae bacterium]|nr:branched-chain amino acid aminotransferase [Lachnospiraceae bacterium]
MEIDRKIVLDEGFLFGLGAFETIALSGRPIWLERHLRRLDATLAFLGISRRVTKEEVYEYLKVENITTGALKIVISEKNKLFFPRENPYTKQDYERGFVADFAKGRRNEHSSLTRHKTLNYGDCILEKRRAAERGFDEAIFLNSKGEICEGCISNIFFVREGKLFTPKLSCGLLPGIVREVLMERCDVTEGQILAEEIGRFEECFLTNSLMGMMPVARIGDCCFESRETIRRVRKEAGIYENGDMG